jgi:two-component system cell cycle response regulator DivK
MSAIVVKAQVNKGRTVLVVDDFDDTRQLMRLWFEKMGYHVVEAENGKEAIRVAQDELPDLIIMDIEMPVLDGLRAARVIHDEEKLRDVPIIAVSAYGREQFRAKALAAGCSEYVSTPFEPDELKKLINDLMRSAEDQ